MKAKCRGVPGATELPAAARRGRSMKLILKSAAAILALAMCPLSAGAAPLPKAAPSEGGMNEGKLSHARPDAAVRLREEDRRSGDAGGAQGQGGPPRSPRRCGRRSPPAYAGEHG